jgi:UPF0755 protein
MKSLARFFVIFFSISFLVGGTLAASFVWDAFLRAPQSGAEEVVISITDGERLDDISLSLKKNNLIPSRLGFKIYTKLIQADRSFKTGDFTLRVGQSYASLVSALTSPTPDEVTIVFPEGLNLEQMVEGVEAAFGAGYGNQWLQGLSLDRWQETYSFLPENLSVVRTLDGYLFPDTYKVSRSGFPDSLTYKLLTNFGEKFSPELRAETIRQGKTIDEIIILASILEREVTGDVDRAKVADIFWRRLKIGMALQADSTVHYVVGSDGSTAYTSDIDRSVDSPYNTYKYPGLPPGPICNPGLSSIRAAIYPEANDAWYFLTDNDGVVHYARTNDEQNQNKVLYLR